MQYTVEHDSDQLDRRHNAQNCRKRSCLFRSRRVERRRRQSNLATRSVADATDVLRVDGLRTSGALADAIGLSADQVLRADGNVVAGHPGLAVQVISHYIL